MKTLIILHGWDSSKEKWEKVKEFLESNDIRVITLDLPGFKEENKLVRAWNLDNYIQWLKEFIRKIKDIREFNGFSKFFLIGHSFGGRIAIKFAANYPELLSGLILVSSAGIKRKKNYFFLFLSKIFNFVMKLPILNRTKPFFRGIFYKYLLRQTDYLKAQEASNFLKETFKNIIDEDLSPDLSKIKTPTLILWGEKDKMTPINDAYLMAKLITNSKLEILEGLSHAPHLENPAFLVSKIKEFLLTLT